jgi:hypothetical protein
MIPVAVAPNKFARGLDGTGRSVPDAYEVVDVREALVRTYATDAHLVAYVLPGRAKQPRINKTGVGIPAGDAYRAGVLVRRRQRWARAVDSTSSSLPRPRSKTPTPSFCTPPASTTRPTGAASCSRSPSPLASTPSSPASAGGSCRSRRRAFASTGRVEIGRATFASRTCGAQGASIGVHGSILRGWLQWRSPRCLSKAEA